MDYNKMVKKYFKAKRHSVKNNNVNCHEIVQKRNDMFHGYTKNHDTTKMRKTKVKTVKPNKSDFTKFLSTKKQPIRIYEEVKQSDLERHMHDQLDKIPSESESVRLHIYDEQEKRFD